MTKKMTKKREKLQFRVYAARDIAKLFNQAISESWTSTQIFDNIYMAELINKIDKYDKTTYQYLNGYYDGQKDLIFNNLIDIDIKTNRLFWISTGKTYIEDNK